MKTRLKYFFFFTALFAAASSVHAAIDLAKIEKLLAEDGSKNSFGWSVSISGDTAVIGNSGDDEGGTAYVFIHLNGIWTLQDKLVPRYNGADSFYFFGRCVFVDGDTALVGATGDDKGAGAAYVFIRSQGKWSQQAKLVANDKKSGDDFGSSVSLSGDTALIGASGDDLYTGSAYVFIRSGGGWKQQAKLVAGGKRRGFPQFGISVSISGDTALIGAPDDSHASHAGVVYLFTRSGGTWDRQQKLTAEDGASGDWFGGRVSVSGDTALIGASGKDEGAVEDVGAVYVFTRSRGGNWTQQQILTASDKEDSDVFGSDVSVSGDTALIGASGDHANTGAAYLFTRTGEAWTQQAKLVSGDGAAEDYFGGSVSVSGDTTLIGASNDNASTGAAYVFTHSGNTNTPEKETAN